MAERCFIKKGSFPPTCGVHNVQLVERQTSREPVVAPIGDFTYLVCPMSGEVANDEGPESN
jgi:hypothetical protein